MKITTAYTSISPQIFPASEQQETPLEAAIMESIQAQVRVTWKWHLPRGIRPVPWQVGQVTKPRLAMTGEATSVASAATPPLMLA